MFLLLVVGDACGFDLVKGNVVEWSKPAFMKEQLSGIEFKAMPSGAHTLQEDMVYLYDVELYGVACYAKMAVESTEERGVRMRSVGVLSQSHDLLHVHKNALSKLVRHILENPGDYSKLEEYYLTWTGNFLVRNSTILPTLNLSYPSAHFERLMSTLGPSLLTIWKAMLLQKRIMFYSPPPAEDICHLIHCANYLMSHSQTIRSNICTPFYYVNIADCDVLSRQVSYIACTTEKVFETKSDIYDVYIDKGEVRVTTSRLKPILCVTRGDRTRLHHLHSMLRRPVSCDESPMMVEDSFYSYFAGLNRLIGEKLARLVASDESMLTKQDVNSMGLDSKDSDFINELLDNLNMDMSVGCTLCDCLPG